MGRASRAKRNRPTVPVDVTGRWYRPALLGATILFVFVCLRVLLNLPQLTRDGTDATKHILAPFVAAAAGAAGGLAYSLVGARLCRIPRYGRYLAGIVTVVAYLLAAFLAVWYVDAASLRELTSNRAAAMISAGIVSIGFGLLVGHTWFEETG